jgi:lysophospholipase L1-like esterase
MKYLKLTFLFALAFLASAFLWQDSKPVLFIIGDSTVKNGDGSGKNKQMGWGTLLPQFFDSSRITVENHAIGGRSSRTFITDGRWDKILARLKPGDYVIMQFGHNDGGALADTSRARGSIRGTGNDSTEIYNPIRKQKEVVYSYGWYMRKYVRDAQEKGAIAIICSPIPRNDWKEGKVNRADRDYGKWSKETAETTGAFFIDLNNSIGEKYEEMGQELVKPLFFGDHTHTSVEGAQLNASIVSEGIKNLRKCKLRKFILKK